MKNFQCKPFSHRGFTLVEMLFVIAIIGILSAVLYPVSTGYFERARDTDRKTSLQSTSLSLRSFHTDMNGFPMADANGCVLDVLKKYTGNHHIFVSPKWKQYNEWCGENGKYGYAVSPDQFTFLLLSTMEWGNRGNLADISGGGFTGTLTQNSLSKLDTLSDGAGMYYVLADPNFLGKFSTFVLPSRAVAPTPVPSPTLPSPAPSRSPAPISTPTPANCQAILQNGYRVNPLNHNSQQNVSKILQNTPANASTSYTAVALCQNGNIIINNEQSQISCNNNFHLVGGQCISNTQNCNIANGSGQQTWNGNGWNSCVVKNCNAGFHKEWNACVSNTRSCHIANGTGQQSWSANHWGSCRVVACHAWYIAGNNYSICKPTKVDKPTTFETPEANVSMGSETVRKRQWMRYVTKTINFSQVTVTKLGIIDNDGVSNPEYVLRDSRNSYSSTNGSFKNLLPGTYNLITFAKVVNGVTGAVTRVENPKQGTVVIKDSPEFECTNNGLYGRYPDPCIDDRGPSASGDGIEFYCDAYYLRACLTGEACPWRRWQYTNRVPTSRAERFGPYSDTAYNFRCWEHKLRDAYEYIKDFNSY